LGFHNLHHLVQAGRIALEGGVKQLKRLEASQRMSQGGDIGRDLSFFCLQVREGLKAPLCLSTHTEKPAFGSGLGGQQKGKLRLLKPVANARAQALKLLKEGQRGIVMFQGVGDKMAYIANPRSGVGSLKQGIDDSFLDI
jgi:hypothetical protein